MFVGNKFPLLKSIRNASSPDDPFPPYGHYPFRADFRNLHMFHLFVIKEVNLGSLLFKYKLLTSYSFECHIVEMCQEVEGEKNN